MPAIDIQKERKKLKSVGKRMSRDWWISKAWELFNELEVREKAAAKAERCGSSGG